MSQFNNSRRGDNRGFNKHRGNRGGFNQGRNSGGRSFGGHRPARPKKEVDIHRIIAHVESMKAIETKAHVNQHTFASFNILPELKQSIGKRGYVDPTPIQDLAIPPILKGQDVVGLADTGTGKSAAFLIPLLNKVLASRQNRTLIVVPTRELAIQLENELYKLAGGLNIHAVICVGGMNIMRQIQNLSRNHNFVIGTPGRLKDLVNRNQLHLERYSAIVLDEVDRMLDMGFVHDMKFLIQKLPENRQSLFFSATMTGEVEKIMKDFVHEYVKVSAKSAGMPANIEQKVVEVTDPAQKYDTLKSVLDQMEVSKTIVFVRTKWGAERLGNQLAKDGYKADSIHGDKRQNQRQRTMQAFKEGKLEVLVATDVAARGIDVASLSHVINFDLPETTEDYTHRIGRVGRAGKTGVAISFKVKG